jgi:uncharacterized protein (TIGR02996 family)
MTFGAPPGGFGSAPERRPESRSAPYEHVWAAPDDDRPRKVLAEQLLERGDPRGEFITLQLAEPEGTTGVAKGLEQELRRHFPRWVPRGVDPDTAVFHRGFLHECRWALETDVADPEWRTVEHLTCVYGAVQFFRGTLFAGSALARLRTLVDADEHALRALSAQRHPRLELLQTRQVTFQQVYGRRGTVFGFPKLHTLDLRLVPGPTEGLSRLVDALVTPAGPQHSLRKFSIDDAGGSIDLLSVSNALQRRPSLLVEVHVEPARRCWVELEGGQARIVFLPSASPSLRRQVAARVAEQRLPVTEVAR